jgi:uncharacterized protein (TIGR03083 family)
VTPVPLPPAAHLPHLARAADGFAEVLATGDLDAPVPACGPWRLTDLAQHLGGIHRWARTAVVEGRPGDEAAADAPATRDALLAWFRDGADALLATLRSTDPDTPCWTFGPRPRTAAFWFRRQAHETAVHAGDAAASQGHLRPYGADLALDGIDEIVGVFVPRQVRLGRIPPLPATLALAPHEGGRWTLDDDAGGAPGATVAGPAEVLLQLLWHRIPLDDARLAVSGDRAAAAAVLGMALTP